MRERERGRERERERETLSRSLALGVRSERPAKQALFGLQSDWSELAYNSASSALRAMQFQFWNCNLGHLECSWSAVPVFMSAI